MNDPSNTAAAPAGVSDPALTDELGSDWTDEGGATPHGPATDFIADEPATDTGTAYESADPNASVATGEGPRGDVHLLTNLASGHTFEVWVSPGQDLLACALAELENHNLPPEVAKGFYLSLYPHH